MLDKRIRDDVKMAMSKHSLTPTRYIIGLAKLFLRRVKMAVRRTYTSVQECIQTTLIKVTTTRLPPSLSKCDAGGFC